MVNHDARDLGRVHIGSRYCPSQQKQAEQRRQACEQSRANMQRLVTSRRIYREDDSGERTYLDEVEMQATRQRVENEISEFCT